MKKTGAFLVRHALEQLGVRYTFGIPGVHNTEIYDQLNESAQITPVLVTHEGGGAFMADALSRTGDSIGTLVIVPAAGMTHALSGIGEAFLAGIPMLVISGGTRRDTGRHYQLHQIDQGRVLDGIVKAYHLADSHTAIIPTLYEAYETATRGEPGPVFVEVPVEVQMFRGVVDALPPYVPSAPASNFSPDAIRRAVDLLTQAEHPGVFVGWGAVDAASQTARLAELLVAPVSTTLQGLSAFSAGHPFHTGFGFGPSSVPASQQAFAACDCLLAVGARFGELGTGSYGLPVPETLIHIDINPAVFNKNYPATVTIEGDACEVLTHLVREVEARGWSSPRQGEALTDLIQTAKEAYIGEWRSARKDDVVSPGYFFGSLREQLDDDAIIVLDDGKHTFLAVELFPVRRPRHFISPTDFNCMGYAVPASIGAKLGNSTKQVAAIVGDGAFLMTGLELLTASTYDAGVMVFVFHDGELGQIARFQQVPLKRKTCTVLGNLDVEGVAIATGAHFVAMKDDSQIDAAIGEAVEVSGRGQPVLVDVNIDYSKRTMLTRGVMKTTLSRFPTAEKMRFIGRAIKRHATG